MDPKKVITGVGTYIQRKIFGVVLFVAGFAGLIAAEYFTRAVSHSDTYYQEHSLPRLFGAVLAFACSYLVLKCIVWVLRWTESEERAVREIDTPKKMDRELVGGVRHIPVIIFALCVVVAFMPV